MMEQIAVFKLYLQPFESCPSPLQVLPDNNLAVLGMIDYNLGG